MGITQSVLSRLEAQHDMYVGTLQRIVKSLRGRLQIIADMPNGQRVSVGQSPEPHACQTDSGCTKRWRAMNAPPCPCDFNTLRIAIRRLVHQRVGWAQSRSH